MAKVNRAKAIANAHKYLAKGDLKKAVREYEKVLKDDPSDIRTKLKVADLWYRIGDKDRAIETFEDVARFYASQGFLLKSVAVYKQVQKLKPDDIGVYLALAGLYQQIGLVSDAIAQYKRAIALQGQAGLTLERLKTAQKMLELDPDNVRLHVLLAEEFSKEGMIQDAVHEFRAALMVLRQKELGDEFIAVAERLLYHQPDDYEVSKVLAGVYIARRDALKALSRLQVCYKAKPNDPEVLDLLAQVFEFLGQPQKTVAVLKALAKEYDRTGLVQDRNEVYARVLKLMPEDREALEALQFAPPTADVTGAEIEFEATPTQEELIPDEEEIGIDDLMEDTHPEVKVPDEFMVDADEDSQPISIEGDRTLVSELPSFEEELPRPVAVKEVQVGAVVDRGSQPIALEEDEAPTLVMKVPPIPFGDVQRPVPISEVSAPIPVDLSLVPPEFQDDIQNLEFLIDSGLREEAAELLQDIRRRAGNLPILARYESLITG